MECRIEDFRYKEVVNIHDGQRLGYVCDALIDIGRCCVVALIVPGRCRLLGLFWREDDYIIPWACIKRIGSDIVLIDVPGEYPRGRRERRPWFTWQFEEKRRP
jgi:YlmC/YmxH family sporulation protein